jgi:phosphatidylglycerol:prolipoprotein diacylglycerol transferase
MYPVLVRIGYLEIRTYGLFLLIAFLVGTILAAREAEREGFRKESIYDLAFWIVVSAVVGSRLLYVIYHWDYYKHSLLETLAFWEGGLVFYGGVIPAILVTVYYTRRKGIPLWKSADWIAPGFALGLFIGRWGCFFNGCCYGKPTSSIFGVTFPEGSFPSIEFGLVKVHPTQLYEGFVNLFIFFFLLFLRRKKPFDGFLFWFYIVLGSLTRFFVDFFRAYEEGVLLFGGRITVNQVIALVLILTSVLMLFILGTRRS